MRVPNVARQVPPEPPVLLPEGEYDAVIERIDEPVRMKTRDYMFRVAFVLRCEGQLLFVNYPGLPDTSILIYRNRKLWIGTTIRVKVRTVQHGEHKYNDTRILWEQV
jgi:hypothetical protein